MLMDHYLDGRGHTDQGISYQCQLKEMAATLAYAVWFLCVCLLGNVLPVDSSHFMGGIIRWRPVNPAAFDGTVRIVNIIARLIHPLYRSNFYRF